MLPEKEEETSYSLIRAVLVVSSWQRSLTLGWQLVSAIVGSCVYMPGTMLISFNTNAACAWRKHVVGVGFRSVEAHRTSCSLFASSG